MSYFPIFINSEGQNVLVLGNKQAADAKRRLLAQFGFSVVQCHTFTDALGERLRAGEFALAIISTGSLERDREFAAQVKKLGVPVNVVDRPELSDFIIPAIVDRSPVTIAISTGGTAPALARKLRFEIERLLPTGLGEVADAARGIRRKVAEKLPDHAARRRFWNRFIDSAWRLAGQRIDAEKLYWQALPERGQPGKVTLVGAGPGDPGLLTLRALNELELADVVVYDRLVASEILGYARRDAELVFVGKSPDQPSKSQEEINDLLIELAGKGKHVVRLKGGDPLIFGRGGEELEALRGAGIETGVVPGITAALGIASALRLPLTHRDMSSQIVLATGRLKDGEAGRFARELGEGRTLAVYMGIRTCGRLVADLMAHGVSGATPVAVVENGTRANERRHFGQLRELPELVRLAEIAAPALILIGDVVALAEDYPQDTAVAGTAFAEPVTNWVSG